MKIEPVKDYKTNTLNSNLFRFSFENKAYAINPVAVAVYVMEPSYVQIAGVINVSIFGISFVVIVYNLILKIFSKKDRDENETKKINKRIIVGIFVIIASQILYSIVKYWLKNNNY